MDAPVTYRRFDDIDGQRQDIYDMAKNAIAEMRPLSNATHQLELADVDYDDDYNPTLADEKEAILRRKSLQRALKATVRLKDAQGNIIEEKRMTVANVPHLNSRGLFIRNGVPYAIRNQLRLRPGVYTRKQQNGSYETQFNVRPGTGRGFRVEMDPGDGLFRFKVDQSSTKLYPVLRALGVSDDEMRSAWGDELFQKNAKTKPGRDELDVIKLVKKFSHDNAEVPTDKASQILKEALERAEVDEDTAELTMGERFKNITAQRILAATVKQLRVARGEAESDNRDSQAYQSFHAAQDLLAERIRRDAARAARNAFWKASKLQSLKNTVVGFLNPNINSLFEGSGLAMPVEDTNPVEIYDTRQAITRLGEGGMSGESVSRDARNVQGSYIGVIDANRAPESSNIGVDLRATDAAMRGSDNQLYTTVRNVKTGELETVSARTLSSRVVTFPGEMAGETKRVPVIRGDRITYAPKDQVDYEVVAPDDMMSRAVRLIPFPEGIKGQRLLMGARMTQQAVPLVEPEAPFVQTGAPDGSSLHAAVGRDVGAKAAPADGIVTKVTPDFIEMTGNDGKRHTIELYNHYPLARKTFLHNEAVVQPGTVVKAGQTLARSNFTDSAGVFAIGRNLRTGYMVAEGDTIEDAFVISESAAKKLGAQAMYKADLDLANVESTDKARFNALYAGAYTQKQLDAMDDDGVIRVGTTVQRGDPLILAIGRKAAPAVGALVKKVSPTLSNKSQTWEHHAPGVVTDVERTKDGIRVLVKSYDIADVGDKLAGRYGNKGVISGNIRPDDQMPIAEDGKPLEVIINANGVISRVNPSQLAEALLGKIVERTGRPPYVVKSFGTPEGVVDFALNEAAKHGVKELETVIDPRDGRAIPNVFVGNSYIMRLHHKAEGKLSARDQGSYTVDDYPARGGPEGSKRISLLDSGTLLAAGATEFLKDAKLARGQRNDDYWRQVRHGETPILPTGSFADEQFKTMLKAAGINIREHGTKEQLRPLLDSDVDRMATHEIENPETFHFETMQPVKGGLFDVGLTGGAGGNKFTKLTLPVKVPHPMFMDPIRRLLGLTGKELDAVLMGKEQLNGKTGPVAVEEALAGIDIDKEIELSKQIIRTGSASKRDAAVKRLHYLAGLKKMNVAPQELMVSKIPIIPPRYRPIVRGRNTDMIHDLNYLYKDLFEARKNYIDAMKTFGEADEEYGTLLKAVHAVSGMEDPVNPKTVEQGVRGVLQFAIGLGTSPKSGGYQRKVIGTSVDTVGRSVITADRSLGLDEVGIPDSMAWRIYRPYIIRRMVANGAPPAEAIQAVEDRTPAASAMLDAEMKQRPVVYNRAPALHRYAYQGAWAKRVPDDSIHVPYYTLKAIGGDFDGDQQVAKVAIDFSSLPLHLRSRIETMSFKCDTAIPTQTDGNFSIIDLQDFPHGELSHSKEGTKGRIDFYEVPPGVKVLGVGSDGKVAPYEVAFWSVHHDRRVEIVNLSSGYQIITDDDPRAVYGVAYGGLEMSRFTPSDALAQRVMVPRVVHLEIPESGVPATIDVAPSLHYSGVAHPTATAVNPQVLVDADVAYTLGVLIGDGWVSGKNSQNNHSASQINLCGLDDDIFREFEKGLAKFFKDGTVPVPTKHSFSAEAAGRYGDVNRVTYSCTAVARAIYDLLGHSCHNKRIPPFFFTSNRSIREALFGGLMDTDGSISVSHAKNKPQLMVNYTTVNLRLARDVVLLAKTLGLRGRITQFTYRGGRTGYVVMFSSIDAGVWAGSGMRCARKLSVFTEAPVADRASSVAARYDLVPVSPKLETTLREHVTLKKAGATLYTAFRKALKDGFTSRCTAERWLALCPEQGGEDFAAFKAIVANISVTWDKVESVDKLDAVETGYDLCVPGAETFMNVDGVILSNTINVHVPSSPEAIEEVKEKLMPSKNLFFTGTFETHYEPTQDYTLGLHLAGKMDPSQKPVTFATVEEAKAAYARGMINARTPIRILSA